MKNIYVIGIITGLSLLVLLLMFGWGFRSGKRSVKPLVAQSDTVIVHDTTLRTILKPDYHLRLDTILHTDTVPADVDTATILKDYFARFVYERRWLDKEVDITLSDTISQNKPLSEQISYRILRPQTIIYKTSTYQKVSNRYVYAGIFINTANASLDGIEAIMASPKWYGGVGYMPMSKGVNLRVGVTIFNFKKNVNECQYSTK
jgi:hypothetical protein